MVAPNRSYRVASYIEAATQLGLQLLIVSDSEHSLVSSIASGITVDFTNPDQAFDLVIHTVADKTILAVIATDDLVVTLSSRIARQLGLPHNDPEASRLTVRKDLARMRLQQHGCNVPEFSVCAFVDAPDHAAEIDYPVVLKPLMLSGSRGVIRADNPAQFISAADRLDKIMAKETAAEYERSHFLVEQFLDGEEIAFDGFVQDGQLLPLAMFDKPEPMNGPFFEESYYITPSRYDDATQQAIRQEIEKCCAAYGLRHGPIHAEARLTDRGVVLLEMASRTIGGQCARLIEYVLGSKLEQVIIQLMCEQSLETEPGANHAGVLMIPIEQSGVLKRVEGMLRAQQVPHITDIEIHIQPGYELVPLPEGSSYLGFIFASAETFDQTLQALREAHQQLDFITSPRWAIEMTGRAV